MDRLSFLANKHNVLIGEGKDGIHLKHKFILFSGEHLKNSITFIISISFVYLIPKVKEVNLWWSILIFISALIALGVVVSILSAYLDYSYITKNKIVFRSNLIKGTINYNAKTIFKIEKEVKEIRGKFRNTHVAQLDFKAINGKNIYSFFEIVYESIGTLDEKGVQEIEELGNLLLKKIERRV